MLPRIPGRYLSVLASLILFQGHAAALVLDWDAIAVAGTWGDGSVNNSYDVDGDAINDITVDVQSNNGATLEPYAVPPNPQTPTVKSFFQGGLTTGIENTLVIALDLSSSLQSVTITVSFASGGATGVIFDLFDIDAGGGVQDHLTMIRGLSLDGSTLIAPFITPGLDNTLIGSGINQSVRGAALTPSTGPTSGEGNVRIDFGTNEIQSFTFTYGATGAFLNPAYQHFATHDINFTPVPEVNPVLMSVVSCLAAAGFIRRHRKGSGK